MFYRITYNYNVLKKIYYIPIHNIYTYINGI